MMRKALFVGTVCLSLVPALVLVGCGGGDEDSAKAGLQTVCPVMGQKIDKKYYVDYKGKRVYFCCDSCPKTFEADPEKYMKKLADTGVILEEVPEDHSSHAH
jgi:YHS domain-containing protein